MVAKNQIRSSITALFPERKCFCLVRPVSDERQLQALDSVPASELRPEFRQVDTGRHPTTASKSPFALLLNRVHSLKGAPPRFTESSLCP